MSEFFFHFYEKVQDGFALKLKIPSSCSAMLTGQKNSVDVEVMESKTIRSPSLHNEEDIKEVIFVNTGILSYG